MQVGVTLTEEDSKRVASYADEKRLSLSSAVRLLTIERLNQIEAK